MHFWIVLVLLCPKALLLKCSLKITCIAVTWFFMRPCSVYRLQIYFEEYVNWIEVTDLGRLQLWDHKRIVRGDGSCVNVRIIVPMKYFRRLTLQSQSEAKVDVFRREYLLRPKIQRSKSEIGLYVNLERFPVQPKENFE